MQQSPQHKCQSLLASNQKRRDSATFLKPPYPLFILESQSECQLGKRIKMPKGVGGGRHGEQSCAYGIKQILLHVYTIFWNIFSSYTETHFNWHLLLFCSVFLHNNLQIRFLKTHDSTTIWHPSWFATVVEREPTVPHPSWTAATPAVAHVIICKEKDSTLTINIIALRC